jgi:hypothetical protein
MDELDPSHQQSGLDADLVEMKQELMLLFSSERLFVGGTTLSLRITAFFVTLGFVSSDTTPKQGFHHVVECTHAAIPGPDLNRAWDGICLGKLFSKLLLERLCVICDREAVKMLLPTRLVAGLPVLVETPIRGSDEPSHPGTAEGLLPSPDAASVLVRRQFSRPDLAVGRHHAHAHQSIPVRVTVKEPSCDLGGEPLRGFAASWTG